MNVPENLEETPTEQRLRSVEADLQNVHTQLRRNEVELINTRAECDKLKRRLEWAYGIIEHLSIGIRNGASSQ